MYADTINADTINAETVLAFSGTRVQAILVRNVKRWPVRGRATVVNLDVEPAYLAEDPRSRIAGLSATTVIDSEIEKAGGSSCSVPTSGPPPPTS